MKRCLTFASGHVELQIRTIDSSHWDITASAVEAATFDIRVI